MKFESLTNLSNYSDHNCLIGYILECERALQLPVNEKTKKKEEEQQPLKSLCRRSRISERLSCEESANLFVNLADIAHFISYHSTSPTSSKK